MAFPTISDADTTSGTVTSNSSSWTLTYPANIAAGDLLVAFLASDGNPNTTWPANWLRSAGSDATAAILYAAKYICTGSETGTFSVTLGANEQGAWRIFRIPAATWEGTIGTTMANAGTSGAVEAVRVVSGGASNTPDPPSLNPFNWDIEDTLWIAACGVDTSRTISVYPLADRNTADVSGGAGGATLGLCTTESAVASLDPGTFTISTSDDWGAITVAVRGTASAPAERVPHFRPYTHLLPH